MRLIARSAEGVDTHLTNGGVRRLPKAGNLIGQVQEAALAGAVYD